MIPTYTFFFTSEKNIFNISLLQVDNVPLNVFHKTNILNI